MIRTQAGKRKSQSSARKVSFRVIIGLLLTIFGGIALSTGIYPSVRAEALVIRVLPVIAFAICMNAVSVLSRQTGFFSWTAAYLTKIAGNSRLAAFFLFSFATVLFTVFLSLDTTVVMLVPAVVCFAAAAKMNPRPLIYTVVWLANTASLLLPISNLTNLLAQQRLADLSVFEFAKSTLLPWVVGVIVPILVLLMLERKTLFGADQFARWDQTLQNDLIGKAAPESSIGRIAAFRLRDVIFSGILILLLCIALLFGNTPWLVALIAATILFCYVQFVMQERPRGLVPAQMTVLLIGLFFSTDVISYLCQDFIVSYTISNADLQGLFSIAGLGLIGANIGNNLPAYLALEPLVDVSTVGATGSPSLLISLLIGVNIGPIIAPWASLATLLWHERLLAEGIDVSWRRFIRRGLILAPVTVTSAVLVLAFNY